MNKDKPLYPETEITPELRAAVLALAVEGKISCAAARALAEKLGVETRLIGYVMDKLGVRVTDCGLGCF